MSEMFVKTFATMWYVRWEIKWKDAPAKPYQT